MEHAYTINIKEILQELVSKAGVSEAELTRKIKIPTATFNKIKTGKITDPRSSTLKIIANYFGLSVDQLLGYAPIPSAEQSALVYVPVLAMDKIIGTNLDKLTYTNHNNWISFNPNSKILGHKMLAFNIHGDAMLPFFDDNTLAIVDCDQKGESKQYVLVQIKAGGCLVLRQLVCDGNIQILKPLNPLFSAISLSKEDRIIGVVVHSVRSFL